MKQASGCLLHLPFAKLDFDRSPAAVAQLHDRIHLHTVVIAVMEHLPIQRLARYPQIPDHQGFEQQAQQLQIRQQPLRASSQRCHSQ